MLYGCRVIDPDTGTGQIHAACYTEQLHGASLRSSATENLPKPFPNDSHRAT